MFVNRKEEQARLRSWWQDPASPIALLWGRRRVGKTLLLNHFAAHLGHPYVFHTATGAPLESELAQLSRAVRAGGASGIRDLASRPFTSWEDALEHLAMAAQDKPILLILDEYPELERTAPHLSSMLRAFIERTAGSTQLRIIVCGSAVRSMYAMQTERAALYGRFGLRLHLKPFSPWESAELLPGLSPSDQAVVYGLLGGMPLYLSWWDSQTSIKSNMRELACQSDARLLTEADLLLATEVEATRLPGAILRAIANGKTRFSKIKDYVGTDPTRTLDHLIELQLVERLVPVTEKAFRSKRIIYRIADNFLSFYLGPLSRYRSEIDRGLGESILPTLMASLDDHLGKPWENAVQTHVRRSAATGRLGDHPTVDVVAVGPWWTQSGQSEIDILVAAKRQQRIVAAGEVKWKRSINAARLMTDLSNKLVAAANSGVKCDPNSVIRLVAARESVTHIEAAAAATGTPVVPITATDVFGELT